ncbi:MAG: YfhO family protein [Bacteroidales bacterium]|nr:YfhO family protein [Bacteroidales bacterium]
MRKLINFLKEKLPIIIVVLLSIPTFVRMFNYGMFSTQDFHIFRLYEYDKCVKSLQIPCRWSPDAGLGYGEPLFNFYGQFSYAVGEVYHILGGSVIDSVKFLFIISLLGSGIAMFFLAKELWKNNASAVLSSIIYLYAPYRAVDVWVRGALPEAFAFVLFPLIILAVEKKSVKWFTVCFSILILVHNLSVVLILPILVVWIIFRKFWKSIFGFAFSLLITASYILPLIFESKYVSLGKTTAGYFDFRAHFVTLYQLFISRFWGYGGSTWGDGDGLSLAVGTIQWALPILVLILIVVKKKMSKDLPFLILIVTGVFYIFLTHNKSTFIWTSISFSSFIQFPWRFLGAAVFCLSLSAGAVMQFFGKTKNVLLIVLILLTMVLNISFFKEDIWYKVGDSYYLTGSEWDRQRTASIGDYWPLFGHEIPTVPSDGKYINYFPGWVGADPEGGLIPSEGTKFTNTTVRTVGNIISLVSIVGLVLMFVKDKKWRKKE